MNDFILCYIVMDLSRIINEEYDKNYLLLRLEEYIEWSKISIKRFSNNSEDYDKYMEKNLKFFQDIQAKLLLDDIDSANQQLVEYLNTSKYI